VRGWYFSPTKIEIRQHCGMVVKIAGLEITQEIVNPQINGAIPPYSSPIGFTGCAVSEMLQ
jgi:hypothetical protein